MARITTLNVPVHLQEKYWRIMATLRRFFFPAVSRRARFLTRSQKARLRRVTYMFHASHLWRAKTPEERTGWRDAGRMMDLNSWQLYLRDKIHRLVNGIPGDAIPSVNHQYKVGHITITSPANEITLTQKHPYNFWIVTKVPGRRKMYRYRRIVERLTFPYRLGISRRTALTAVGPLPFCFLIFNVTHFHRGKVFYTKFPIEMPLSADWGIQERTITAPGGHIGTYELQIRLNDVVGEIWFDNIISEHTGTNFARDPHCEDITKEFFDEWYRVARNWEPTLVPEGASWESIYPIMFLWSDPRFAWSSDKISWSGQPV